MSHLFMDRDFKAKKKNKKNIYIYFYLLNAYSKINRSVDSMSDNPFKFHNYFSSNYEDTIIRITWPSSRHAPRISTIREVSWSSSDSELWMTLSDREWPSGTNTSYDLRCICTLSLITLRTLGKLRIRMNEPFLINYEMMLRLIVDSFHYKN